MPIGPIGSEGPDFNGLHYQLYTSKRGQSLEDVVFGPGGSRATMIIYIDGKPEGVDLVDVPSTLLGYTVFDLTRKIPAAHPQYPWLYCTRILSMKGIKAQSSSSDNPQWLYYVMTLQFETIPYDIKDGLEDKPYNNYCLKIPETRNEFQTLERGTYQLEMVINQPLADGVHVDFTGTLTSEEDSGTLREPAWTSV